MSASLFIRSERGGSIFSRITGLIRAGKINWENRPLWYDIYASHPPFNEPIWDCKMPNHDKPVRKIFYEEDLKRAKEDDSKVIYDLLSLNQTLPKDLKNTFNNHNVKKDN